MPQNSTTSHNPDSCTCDVCKFIQVMARQLPALPQDLNGMSDALSLLLLNAESREVFKLVLRGFDSMGRPGRKQISRALAEMDGTQRSLAIVLLDHETRDALKSMVRAADRGDV